MSRPIALTPTPDPARDHLDDLERRVSLREHELDALKSELLQLQTRYLSEMGPLYAELNSLESAVAEIEIRAGLRPPPEAPSDDPGDSGDPGDGCSNRSAPSVDLKRIFREVAKAVHPDRTLDEAARYRRHSLMAEANRAYAEQDEDRLRLILHTWERSPEAVIGDGPEADALRRQRRVSALEDQLTAMDREFADVRGSAIARLQRKIDEARGQGWDLFAEMLLQVKREIARASARLASLRRMVGSARGGAGAPAPQQR